MTVFKELCGKGIGIHYLYFLIGKTGAKGLNQKTDIPNVSIQFPRISGTDKTKQNKTINKKTLNKQPQKNQNTTPTHTLIRKEKAKFPLKF